MIRNYSARGCQLISLERQILLTPLFYCIFLTFFKNSFYFFWNMSKIQAYLFFSMNYKNVHFSRAPKWKLWDWEWIMIKEQPQSVLLFKKYEQGEGNINFPRFFTHCIRRGLKTAAISKLTLFHPIYSFLYTHIVFKVIYLVEIYLDSLSSRNTIFLWHRAHSWCKSFIIL